MAHRALWPHACVCLANAAVKQMGEIMATQFNRSSAKNNEPATETDLCYRTADEVLIELNNTLMMLSFVTL